MDSKTAARAKQSGAKKQKYNRIYMCQFQECFKSYSSYPALYNHFKSKHKHLGINKIGEFVAKERERVGKMPSYAPAHGTRQVVAPPKVSNKASAKAEEPPIEPRSEMVSASKKIRKKKGRPKLSVEEKRLRQKTRLKLKKEIKQKRRLQKLLRIKEREKLQKLKLRKQKMQQKAQAAKADPKKRGKTKEASTETSSSSEEQPKPEAVDPKPAAKRLGRPPKYKYEIVDGKVIKTLIQKPLLKPTKRPKAKEEPPES